MEKTLKIIVIFSMLQLLSSITITAQKGTGVYIDDMPYDEIHVKYDKPMPYQFVREADVMWSKVIWRRIELSEKMNHILALPAEETRGTKSLIDVILEGIETIGVTGYEATPRDAGREFNTAIKIERIKELLGAKTFELVENLEGSMDTIYLDAPRYNTSDIDAYVVKELWFFDKQRSVLDVRIIGLCPVRKYYSEEDELAGNYDDPRHSKVFWVRYSDIRPLLAQSPIYNPYSDLKSLTYDDIFQKRFFSGYIIMESNPYNRSIDAYESGLEVLLEADRIKNEIFNLEQDLWEY